MKNESEVEATLSALSQAERLVLNRIERPNGEFILKNDMVQEVEITN